MSKNKFNAEAKVLEAAKSIFLLFGYHGTTLQQIASKAVVNKATIHYYYRSKERLYVKVVNSVLDDILHAKKGCISNSNAYEKQRWFLFTELYNNQICFEKAIRALYISDWDKKLNEIKGLAKF